MKVRLLVEEGHTRDVIWNVEMNIKEAEQVVRECEQNFVEDNCMGLVKQVVASLTRRDIKA